MQNMRLAEMTRVWEERVWVTRMKKMIQEPLFFLYIDIFLWEWRYFLPNFRCSPTQLELMNSPVGLVM